MKGNRIISTFLFSAFILVLLGACSSVIMKQPLSSNMSPEDQAALSGKWNAGGDVLHIKFAKDGTGHYGGINWSAKTSEFRLSQGKFWTCPGTGIHYASLLVEDSKDKPKEYMLIAYRFKDKDHVEVGSPNLDMFIKAVEAKKLKGTVQKKKYTKTVTLTGTAEEILNFLNSNGGEKLFVFNDTNVMERLKLKEEKKS